MTSASERDAATGRSVPTVCVCNAVDTMHDFAVRAPDVERLLSECYAQQDQALYWGPLDKLLVTYEPIAELAWQTEFLGLHGVINRSPARSTGSLFADMLADDELIAALVDHAGPGKRFRLIPHTTTADLWRFVDVLTDVHGIRIDLPESTADQDLRDLADTKAGLRDLATELGMADGACRIPRGYHCATPSETLTAIDVHLAAGQPCIVKPDKGEGSLGLLIFRPGDPASDIANTVHDSAFYGADTVVVEHYIDGDVSFPSVEYVIPAEKSEPPRVCYVTDMLFGGPTQLRGNVTSRTFAQEHWYQPLLDGTRALAEELQRRGYRGHFGIDAITRPGDAVFMHDLNARRTGSTHVHEFGAQLIGAHYLDTHVVGNFDFYGLPEGTSLAQVLDVWGELVRSPRDAASGVVPAELTGLARGRLSCMAFAPDLAQFHDMIKRARVALERELDMAQ